MLNVFVNGSCSALKKETDTHTHTHTHAVSSTLSKTALSDSERNFSAFGNTVKNDALTERVRNRPEQRVTVPGGTEGESGGSLSLLSANL